MYRYAYDPPQPVICYLERLKAVMRDLKAINWGPTDESVRKVIWHTTEATRQNGQCQSSTVGWL